MVCYFDDFAATISATDDGMKIIENGSLKPENYLASTVSCRKMIEL